MLAEAEQGFGDVFADAAAGLEGVSEGRSLGFWGGIWGWTGKGFGDLRECLTYPDNGDFLYVVFETWWLLAGVFWGHCGGERMVAEV